MAKIHLYFRNHKTDSKDGFIWIRFYLNSEKVNFTTKVECNIKNWNEITNRVSTADSFASDKNLILDKYLARINDVFVKYRLKNRVLTKEGFNRAFSRPDDHDNFFSFAKEYQKKFAVMNEANTMKVHATVLKKVQDYSPSLHFDDITTDFLDEYYAYLCKKAKNCENTAYKNMATFKKYVRAAYKAGYMDENPFDSWSIKRSTASYTYLTEEELSKLLKIYRSGELDEKYHKTLEFFLFMCFGSQHVGDARPMQLEQFTPDSFVYLRQKTRHKKPMPIMVPVSDVLREILSNIVGTRKKGRIFTELPADQTMNERLKEIARYAGINKPITHKTGRHSFATYFLRKTKDLTSLKEILGHSELRETLIYAHVLDESKHEGITCFNGL